MKTTCPKIHHRIMRLVKTKFNEIKKQNKTKNTLTQASRNVTWECTTINRLFLAFPRDLFLVSHLLSYAGELWPLCFKNEIGEIKKRNQ